MDFMTIIIIAVVGGVILGILQSIDTSNKKKEVGSAIASIPDFTVSFEYLGADGNNGIAIDEENSKVCLLSQSGAELTHRIVSHKDILSSELFEDGQTVTKTVRTSQIVGTAVGGLLLGGVGAIIGGLSGSKVEKGKIKRIDLRLVVNDSINPLHDVCFLAVESKRDGMLYKMTAEQARQWQARMDVLIKRSDKEVKSTNSEAASVTAASIGDEFKKLADLKVQGILTDEEFLAQKAKLLG